MPTNIDPNAPAAPAPAARPDPYVLGVPFEQITSDDWNEIQIRGREELHAHQHNGRDGTPPIARPGIADNAVDGTKIDPASEVNIKKLIVDTSVSAVDLSVLGGVSGKTLTISSGLTMDLAANDKTFFLRGATDTNHGLGYRAQFAGVAIDGPALFGYAGGALGTNAFGAMKAALTWDGSQNVNMPGKLSARSVATAESSSIGGNLSIGGTDVSLDNPGRRGPNNKNLPRRALVHDGDDSLAVNYGFDYPGGVSVRGPVAMPEGVKGALSVGGMQLDRNDPTSSKVVADGRLHLMGPERLYLLNKSGVYITNAWGGNGNLTVQGQTTIGASEQFAGNNPRALNVVGEIKSFSSGAGLRLEDRSNAGDASREWVMYAQGDAMRMWRTAQNKDLLTVDSAGLLTVTAINSKPVVQSFRVDGDINTFYPVVFGDGAWGDGPLELQLSRTNTHQDSQWRGSLVAVVRWHATSWGNGSEFLDFEQYYAGNAFVAGYQSLNTSPELVIWLRGGGTTYFYRSNHPINAVDASAQKKTRGANNSETFDIKTQIDATVAASGKKLGKPLSLLTLNMDGPIVPSIGNADGKGIQWATDAFGGGGTGGDVAFIRYYRPSATGEDTKLLIGNQNDAGDTIGFYQFNDERMTIANGNVGIGTQSPGDKLDVKGNVQLCTDLNPIHFTGKWGAYGNGSNHAEISNDNDQYKALMIAGNGASGTRRVQVFDRLDVNGNLFIAGGATQNGTDFFIDNSSRRTGHLGDYRRTLVHDGYDWLTINYANDYRGGTRVSSRLEVNGELSLPLNDIYLAGTDNPYHGLGYYGGYKYFMGTGSIDGPVIYGYSGGALGSNQAYISGVQGGLTFNGADGYVELPTMDFDFSNGFTVETWIKWDAFNNYSRIFDFGNGAGTDNILWANEGTTSNLTFHSYAGAQLKNRIDAPGAIAAGQWLYLVVTIDKNGAATMYKNGVQVATMANFGLPLKIARTKSYIGKSNWADPYFKGSIGLLRFWQRCLTPAEVRDFSVRHYIGREGYMAACYNFNGVSGQTQAFDSSASAKHGTLRGGVTWLTVQNVALRWDAGGNVGIGTTVANERLEVKGNLRICTDKNPLRFTSAWSAFPDNTTNQSEICNDTDGYKALMIVGNKSAGDVRRVQIWDRLDVRGSLLISGGGLTFTDGTKQSTATRVVTGVIGCGRLQNVQAWTKTFYPADVGLRKFTSATASMAKVDFEHSVNSRFMITPTVAGDGSYVTLRAETWADTLLYDGWVSYVLVGYE